MAERREGNGAPDDVRALAEAVAEALEARGAPAGAWLVEINRVRVALRQADDLLRRMEDAVIRSATGVSASPLRAGEAPPPAPRAG